MLKVCIGNADNDLSKLDYEIIADKTDGFSISDIVTLVKAVQIFAERDAETELLRLSHVLKVLNEVRASTSNEDIARHLQWNEDFGQEG